MSVASDSTPAAPPPAPSAERRPAAGAGFGLFKRLLLIKEGSIIVVTLVTIIYFLVSTKHIATTASFDNFLDFFAPYAILAAGEVFVMVNGEIDLSIGGTWLISPFIFNEFTGAHIPLVIAMLLAILVCSIVGLINGVLVSVVGISSFVTTLGTLFALSGVTLVVSHQQQITTPGTSLFGGGTFESIMGGGTYSELFWAIGICAILQFVLTFTKWGIYTVAVGGNRLGAKEAGINERFNLIGNFVMCATLAGFVGILMAVQSTSANPDPSTANQLLFQAISAAVIGGTLLVGGYGTIVGAFIGALFYGVIQDGLDIKGVNANYDYLYLGIAILIAMTINVYIARVRAGRGSG